MKKNKLILLLAVLAINSCGENPSISNTPSDTPTNNDISNDELSSESPNGSSESESESTPEIKDIYAIINSHYDTVHIYGVVNETFDLSTIDYSRVFDGTPTYKTESLTELTISDSTITFNKKGTYKVTAYNKKTALFDLMITVNEDEESRYNMPFDLDYSNFTMHSGNKDNIVVTNKKISMNCKNAGGGADNWQRFIYDLPQEYSTNYTIECDVSFKDSIDNTRWFGLVFRDQETNKNKYPYYQLDFRRKTNESNSIELTYVYVDGQYSYPYKSSWENGGPGVLYETDIVHMKLSLKDRSAFCELSTGDYTTSFEVLLSNVTSGGFGFQCSQANVEISNINLKIDSDTILSSSANTQDSLVNIYDNTINALKPNIIASGETTDEIYGVGMDVQQYYIKVEDKKLYNINNNLMDINLNDIFLETKGAYIPNIQIENSDDLLYVNEVCKSFGVVDLVIWSSNEDVLIKART